MTAFASTNLQEKSLKIPHGKGVTNLKFGSTIKAIREERGLKKTDLAKRVGKTSGYLTQLETDKIQPSTEALQDICTELGFPLYIFIMEATINQNSNCPSVSDVRSLLQPLHSRVKKMLLMKSENPDLIIPDLHRLNN